MDNLQQIYTKQATKLHQYTRDSSNYYTAKRVLLENYILINKNSDVNINILRQMHNKYASKLNIGLFDSLLGLSIETITNRLGI